ncbi:hypothetical protein PG993_009035 [Apiospora rasikravindrae]|uniref:Uncharacterized protein n=1 Tax=Apiospora rasikravindrae TaxID=990691 RepID=A0ABR1SJZ5_9PEZI
MVQRDNVTDVDITIRFKHGACTVFLFVDPMSTFADVSSELLEVLQERYPEGIPSTPTPASAQPDDDDAKGPATALPDDASQIAYALPKSATDPTQGWKPLKVGSSDTVVSKGVKNGAMVAFAFKDEEGEVDFEVHFPTYDDEVEEEM